MRFSCRAWIIVSLFVLLCSVARRSCPRIDPAQVKSPRVKFDYAYEISAGLHSHAPIARAATRAETAG
jgi:hypothetical protein